MNEWSHHDVNINYDLRKNKNGYSEMFSQVLRICKDSYYTWSNNGALINPLCIPLRKLILCMYTVLSIGAVASAV